MNGDDTFDKPASMRSQDELDLLCINTLRTLSIDMVQKANSGHPGTPMGAAPTAYTIWQKFLVFSPDDPTWMNRDRFVLSVGHASALLYSLLYLCDVKENTQVPNRLAVSMADLQSFRQLGSRCTGHPEHGWTAGVEATTGPLGQGLANSVGMAITERWLAATYNRSEHRVFDYQVYALCGDGDMMEGISGESASLAGHLALSNLCWIYDSNHISIEGDTAITFTDDIVAKFRAYGWQVICVDDANDLTQQTSALQRFLDTKDKPTLIIVKSHIGYGAPNKQDNKAAHGEPLGVEEAKLAKQFYRMDPEAQFAVPDGVQAHFKAHFGERGRDAHTDWNSQFAIYRQHYPDLAKQIDCMQLGDIPPTWNVDLPVFSTDEKGLATRESSGRLLNAIAKHIPWLMGGAADLAPSTKSHLDFQAAGNFEANVANVVGDVGSAIEESFSNYAGRNFHFGIREHAMCAIANGMALSKLRPYVASFFVFSDYARAAIRLAAMMGMPVIYLWTHDSISMGEDGPTHQAIEQLASFRAMPGMVLLRPADANEVIEAWRVIMNIRDRPVSLVLSRQALPTIDRSRYASASGLANGAYIIAGENDANPAVLLIGTGSEVPLCIAAYELLKAEGIVARVISMPSWDLFERQSAQYRDYVLPPKVVARVSVEAASPLGWERYVGQHGAMIAMHSFGLSGPGRLVEAHFGFEASYVVAAARAQILRHGTVIE